MLTVCSNIQEMYQFLISPSAKVFYDRFHRLNDRVSLFYICHTTRRLSFSLKKGFTAGRLLDDGGSKECILCTVLDSTFFFYCFSFSSTCSIRFHSTKTSGSNVGQRVTERTVLHLDMVVQRITITLSALPPMFLSMVIPSVILHSKIMIFRKDLGLLADIQTHE